jgi:hypothetical protein
MRGAPIRSPALDFRYKHVEAALAQVFEIDSRKMARFRARLRHLRELGVPALPKPGSGQQIAYRRDHAIAALIALKLEQVGMPPQKAAHVTRGLARDWILDADAAIAKQAPYLLIVRPGGGFQFEELFGVVGGSWTELDFGVLAKEPGVVITVPMNASIVALDRFLKSAVHRA